MPQADLRALVRGQIRVSDTAAWAGDVAPDPHPPTLRPLKHPEARKGPQAAVHLAASQPASHDLKELSEKKLSKPNHGLLLLWEWSTWGEWGHWGRGQRAAASWLVRAPGLAGSAGLHIRRADPSMQAGPELLLLSMAGPRDTSDS